MILHSHPHTQQAVPSHKAEVQLPLVYVLHSYPQQKMSSHQNAKEMTCVLNREESCSCIIILESHANIFYWSVINN